MTKTENRIYFSGINSLRFMAALAVIITHIELLKGTFGFESYWKNPIIFNLGGMGVYFFFVLSGFLITYLLLVEKEEYGKIAIKQFYLRRILRIWPLYYLILLLGFFVLPQFEVFHISYLQNSFYENFNANIILYIFILPNLAFSLFTAVPNIGQVWSIGVEEQFYIIWPWIVEKSKNILKTLVLIIVCLIILKIVVLIFGEFYSTAGWYKALRLFVAMSKFECMAIGGIGAYMLFTRNNILKIIYNKYLMITAIISLPLLIYITPAYLQDGIHVVYSFSFLIIILNVSKGGEKSFLENSTFNYLGKISYGIYMYHFMVVPLVLNIFKKHIALKSEFLLNFGIYSLTILITIALSSISYRYFEKPFINLKSKFSPVKSGD